MKQGVCFERDGCYQMMCVDNDTLLIRIVLFFDFGLKTTKAIIHQTDFHL